MKLKNHLISSLRAFGDFFDFAEAWSKIDIVIRDISPERMYYDNECDLLYYRALAAPEQVTICNNEFIFPDGTVLPLELDDEEITILEPLQGTTKIQFIALMHYSRKTITPEMVSLAANKLDISAPQIILTSGRTIRCVPCDHADPTPLTPKPIIVSADAKAPCRIGNQTLNPGDATYGIFQGDRLIAVAPKEATNKSYDLRYRYNSETGKIKLIVTDRMSASKVAEYDTCFYTLINDNNFAIIDGLRVETYIDDVLNRKLLNQVSRILGPQIITCDNNNITVTYKNYQTIQIPIS